jgi:hypothetical protein
MEREIDDAVAGDVQTADRVVDGERRIDERPVRHRRISWRREDCAQVCQIADLWIADDTAKVVEDERIGEAVRVGRDSRSQDQRDGPAGDAR